jgi:large subunit ribosomal protein L21
MSQDNENVTTENSPEDKLPKKKSSEDSKEQHLKYAVIQASGKQFKVTEGSKVCIDLSSSKTGDEITFNEVLFFSSGLISTNQETQYKIGTPLIQGASVKGKIIKEVKAKKVTIFKKVNRNGYTKKQGHRQKYFEVKIGSISI